MPGSRPRARRPGPRSSPGRGMRSPGRSTTRRSWRRWPSVGQRRARCPRPADRDPAGRGQRLRGRDRGPRRGAGGGARCPLLHLPRGRAAQRRPGGRGGRAGDRAGAGARSRSRRCARRAGGDRGGPEPARRCARGRQTGGRADPNSAPARIALSYALQAGFDLEAARATLREAAARTPENALVQASLAEIELSFGDLDAAQATAERAVALAPDLARTQMVLGFAALTRIDIDWRQGGVRARDRAGFRRAAGAARPRPREDPRGRPRGRPARDRDRGRARSQQLTHPQLPRQGLLRGEPRPPDAQQYEIAKQLDPNDPTPWFYDAILLQTENRPVEALHDIETSIELNDNRAVYRSRLLLDADIAVRGTSLARSTTTSASSSSASRGHPVAQRGSRQLLGAPVPVRHLSAPAPPRDRAASELLQYQLLQPININPVRPSLPFTDLNVVTGACPSKSAFNEFTPLFARRPPRGTAPPSGAPTTLRRRGCLVQAVRSNVAVGRRSGFTTDGFRANNDDRPAWPSLCAGRGNAKLNLRPSTASATPTRVIWRLILIQTSSRPMPVVMSNSKRRGSAYVTHRHRVRISWSLFCTPIARRILAT